MAKLPGAIQGARIVGERFVHTQRRANPDGRMPLMDHLRELRNRVVKAALALVAGMIIGWVFFGPIWDFIKRPYCRAVNGCSEKINGHFLVVNGPLDGFYLHIKVGFVVGIILTSPIWLYQLWAFVAPGLYSREKKWTYLFVGTAVPLFVLGTYFALLVMDRGLHFLIGMVPNSTIAFFTADTYIGYFMMMVLGFGLCFELPLLLVMLNRVGILTHARFKKWRRVMIFLVFVFAGIASPSPDPITMLILGAVCAALVESAEVIVFLHDRRRARLHPDPYAGLADDELSPLDLGDSELDDTELSDSGSEN
ncbi:MAG TPA: twin-arginine translocase subunit TatC [Streptosporangiaceae bacterium]